MSFQLPNLTSEDYGGLSGLLSESLVQPSPLSKICTYPEWAKGLAKSLWTPHIQHTPSLNCCLVDASELWAPERPDTGRVSSLRQSISWTLDNNVRHITLQYIIIHHTYLFTSQMYTLPIVYILILCIIIILSLEVSSMHCVLTYMVPTHCPLLPTPWAGEICWSLLHFRTCIHGFALRHSLQHLHT